MLRINLLLTTAFVVAGSLALHATQDWAIARSATAEPARDRNEEFLGTYGPATGFSISGSSKQTSHSGYIHTVRHRQYVEVPIVGKGQTINSIIVKEWASNASGQPFSATLYSSSGYVAYGTATAHSKHPSQVVIPIKQTTLKKNTTYWIEETLPYCIHCLNKAFWKANPRTKLRAYVEDWRYSASSSSGGYNWSFSSSSPWTLQNSGPFVRVK